MERKCSSCEKIKSESEFYKNNPKTNKVYSWCKECYSFQTKRRQWKFKIICVNYKGGKCQKCGYDENITALDFHHRDPKEKDFPISAKKSLKFDLKTINELDKCDLLCANCHRLEHNACNETIIRELQQSVKIKKQILIKKICPHCNNEFVRIHPKTYCSQECAKLSNRKVERPTKEQLENDIINFSFCELGKKYNVSDNAVRKWAKQYGLDLTKAKNHQLRIPFPKTKNCVFCDKEFSLTSDNPDQKFCSKQCKINLEQSKSNKPSKEQLELELKNNTYKKLGEKYNVSLQTIRKWAISYDLISI